MTKNPQMICCVPQMWPNMWAQVVLLTSASCFAWKKNSKTKRQLPNVARCIWLPSQKESSRDALDYFQSSVARAPRDPVANSDPGRKAGTRRFGGRVHLELGEEGISWALRNNYLKPAANWSSGLGLRWYPLLAGRGETGPKPKVRCRSHTGV